MAALDSATPLVAPESPRRRTLQGFISLRSPEATAAMTLVHRIVSTIVQNPGNRKFCSINLAGKAGLQLVAVPESLDYLKSVGFVEVEGNHLELPVTAGGLDFALSTLLATGAPGLPAPAPAPVAVDPTAGMSLKQKANYMAEQKAKEERENAKRVREEELAKLKQDKMVREKDPNWSAQAAGVKGGKPILTFRDKCGEDAGGG